MPNTQEDRLLRDREVAELLSCSTRHVWSLYAAGNLPAVKIGPRCTRFRRSDVDRLMREGIGGQ